MKVKISQLIISNFKGIKSLTVDFNDITNISGDNGTCKSSIFDAFSWLLFGKDSHDSKDFNIKTLDENGIAIPQIEHSVSGIIYRDGTQLILKRVYNEKWTRRRGSEESELTGHETLFYFNDVPLQAGEFKAKVDELVSENLFKLLTSTTAFNSLKWQDRRQVLIQIAGNINRFSLTSNLDKSQAEIISEILDKEKNLTEYKKSIAVRKKKLSDDLKLIPSRIDEVQRGIPQQEDFEKIRLDVQAKEKLLSEIELTITNEAEAYKKKTEGLQEIQGKIYELKKKRQSIEYGLQNDALRAKNEHERKTNDLNQNIDIATRSLMQVDLSDQKLTKDIEDAEKSLLGFRQKWHDISIETVEFDANQFVCPTCKRTLSAETIEEKKEQMIANFQNDQSRRMSDVQASGKQMAGLIDKFKAEKEQVKEKRESLTLELDGLRTALKFGEETALVPIQLPDQHPEWIEAGKEIDRLELQLLEIPALDVEGLKGQKATIQNEIYQLKASLGHEEVIRRGNTRINELMAEEKSLSQQISNLEKSEFAIESFTRSKMNLVEQAVNSRFVLVKFKMFNTLLNGGIEECCDCTVNGVPYPDVNSAGKIQAGIDIINTLSDHYNIYCPVWCDNRETVNVIPPTKSQLINLNVTKTPLTIN